MIRSCGGYCKIGSILDEHCLLVWDAAEIEKNKKSFFKKGFCLF